MILHHMRKVNEKISYAASTTIIMTSIVFHHLVLSAHYFMNTISSINRLILMC